MKKARVLVLLLTCVSLLSANVRWFEFQGNDRLLLIPREDGKGGVIDRKNATFKLLWERIK